MGRGYTIILEAAAVGVLLSLLLGWFILNMPVEQGDGPVLADPVQVVQYHD